MSWKTSSLCGVLFAVGMFAGGLLQHYCCEPAQASNSITASSDADLEPLPHPSAELMKIVSEVEAKKAENEATFAGLSSLYWDTSTTETRVAVFKKMAEKAKSPKELNQVKCLAACLSFE